MRLTVKGLGACSQIDPAYPNGCPSGFTPQPVFYVPNSGQSEEFGTPGPGYVPLPVPTDNSGCQSYSCVNSSGLGPAQAVQSSCPKYTPLTIGMVAGAGIGLLVLPDLWKLLAIPAAVAGIFLGGTYDPYGPVDPTTGLPTCIVNTTISL